MASAKLTRTLSGNGNQNTATWSFWVKRSGLTDTRMYASWYDGNNQFWIMFSDNKFNVKLYQSSSYSVSVETNRLFRDTSAWYHIVVAIDTTQGTASDRVKIYVNGSQETDLGSTTYPSQNQSMPFGLATYNQRIGFRDAEEYLDGSISHYHFIDGTAYTPSTFGETDSTSGIWKPKTNPSVTYGTNGFFLKFENSGAMGTDSSGNSNTWTVGGTLTQNVDTPSNNFATFNPFYSIEYNSSLFFTNGNTTVNLNTAAWNTIPCTMELSSGKWYFEGYGHTNSSNYIHYGITSSAKMNANRTQPESEIQANANGYAYGYYGSNGQMYYSTTSASTTTSYGNSYTSSDYIGIFMDLDNNKLYFAKNGTLQNSGTGFDIGADGKPYLPCISLYNGATNVNFGSGVFGTTALTGTTYTDANGEGTFKYSPNQGGASNFDSSAKNFYALNTKNIKEFG